MRLFINLSGSSVNELRFDRGPIYIGRQQGNQVFLPDPAVSRQHAVFYTTRDGTWILEDLGSANKTYVNQTAIHKSEVKNNDLIQIADFQIRVSLEEDEDVEVEKEETLVGEVHLRKELHTVERRPEASDAPPIKFPAKRIAHWEEFLTDMDGQRSLEDLFGTLERTLARQFRALNVWLSLRREPGGPMEFQGGRKVNTEAVQRVDLAVPESLDEALRHNRFMLIHQMPRQIINRGIRSVLIAPIVYEKQNYGVIYIENSTEHPHYNLTDLDYLIVLAVYTGALIRRIKK